jgi:hypothetical protein
MYVCVFLFFYHSYRNFTRFSEIVIKYAHTNFHLKRKKSFIYLLMQNYTVCSSTTARRNLQLNKLLNKYLALGSDNIHFFPRRYKIKIQTFGGLVDTQLSKLKLEYLKQKLT